MTDQARWEPSKDDLFAHGFTVDALADGSFMLRYGGRFGTRQMVLI